MDDYGNPLPTGYYMYQVSVELIRSKKDGSKKEKVMDILISPWRFLRLNRPASFQAIQNIQKDYQDYVESVRQGIVSDPAIEDLLSGGLRPAVTYKTRTGCVTRIVAPSLKISIPTVLPDESPETAARKFLAHYSEMLGIEAESLSFRSNWIRDFNGITAVSLRPYLGDHRILGNDIVVHVNTENQISFYSGDRLMTNIVSDVLAYTPSEIADLHDLDCTPFREEVVWIEVDEGLAIGYTFHCSQNWMTADAATGEILRSRSNRFYYPSGDMMHLYCPWWSWWTVRGDLDPQYNQKDPFIFYCYNIGWNDTGGYWLGEIHNDPEPLQNKWCHPGATIGNFGLDIGFDWPNFFEMRDDVIAAAVKYWYDNFDGCAGPACDNSVPIRVALDVETDNDNHFNSAEGVIRVDALLLDEGTDAVDWNDKWVFWHEAEHEKMYYLLGEQMPVGGHALGIGEGHARIAERAIAYDALSKPLPTQHDDQFLGGYPIFHRSQSWDLFVTKFQAQGLAHQENLASNWFLTMASIGSHESVYLDDLYDPVVPYGIVHQMVASGAFQLSSFDYLAWGNLLAYSGQLWYRSPSAPVTLLWKDATLAAHSVGLWTGPVPLPETKPSPDAPDGVQLIVDGVDTLFFVYRADGDHPNQVVVQKYNQINGFHSPQEHPQHSLTVSEYSPGVFKDGNGDAIVYWVSADSAHPWRIWYFKIFSDIGENPMNAGGFSEIRWYSGMQGGGEPLTDAKPAGIHWAGSNLFVYKKKGLPEVDILRWSDGKTFSLPNVQAAPYIGVAVAGVQTGLCSQGESRRLFVASVETNHDIMLTELRTDQVEDGYFIVNQLFLSAFSGLFTPFDTITYDTPTLALVSFDDMVWPSGYRHPYKLYIGWKHMDGDKVLSRVFFGSESCQGVILNPLALVSSAGPMVEQGLSVAAPKMIVTDMDVDPNHSYQVLTMFMTKRLSVNSLPTSQGQVSWMWKVVERRQ